MITAEQALKLAQINISEDIKYLDNSIRTYSYHGKTRFVYTNSEKERSEIIKNYLIKMGYRVLVTYNRTLNHYVFIINWDKNELDIPKSNNK